MAQKSEAKPIILHLGDAVKWNTSLYKDLEKQYTLIRPSEEERQRENFLKALKDRQWGDFSAVLRPFWNTGGEMGQWDQELISLLPKSLKIFASAGAGYNWADVDVLAEHGIIYCNGAGQSSEAVADMALYHIISAFRNLTWSSLAARSANVEEFKVAHRDVPSTAWNPRDHILGIVGLGSIGFLLAQKAHAALGMKIHYHDIMRKNEPQEQEVAATFHDDLDSLLSTSDCVVIATPFSGDQLLDASRLAKFKKGSRLINIARGGLVDEDALVDALESGHIVAAGLDVHEHEPHVNPKLATMKNVNLTCHNAGGSMQTIIGFERLAMENVQRVLTGQEPLTPVNMKMMKK